MKTKQVNFSRKKKYLILSMILSAMLIGCKSSSEITSSYTVTPEATPSSMFISIVEAVYTDTTVYIMDENGKDISHQFKKDCQAMYDNKDYSAIENYFLENNLSAELTQTFIDQNESE